MIKKLEYTEQWDFHRTHNILYIENKNVICRLTIEITEDYKKITSLYVQEKYRGQGYSNKLIEDALNYCDEYIKEDIYLMVRRDNFIIKTYKKYGFKFDSDNGIYVWLKKETK